MKPIEDAERENPEARVRRDLDKGLSLAMWDVGYVLGVLDGERNEIRRLERKLEAAEQHITVCQRRNTEEVERRRAAEAGLKEILSIIEELKAKT